MTNLNVANALLIRGWMNPLELAWLAEAATRAPRIAEIGSAWGRSTRALGDHTPGLVYAVDTWMGDAPAARKLDQQVTWNDDTSTAQYEKLGGEAIFSAFKTNCRDLIAGGKVYPIRMESTQAARVVPNDLDLVFIDGSHDEVSVEADIATWMPKLRRGGVLAGHDYSGVPWHEVKKVVDRTFSKVLVHETIWAVGV